MSTMSQRLAAHADAHISPPTPPTPSTPSDELDLEVESTSEGVDVGRDAPLSVEAQVLPAETHPRCLHKAILKSPSMRPNKGQAGWGNLPAELINTILTFVNDTVFVDPSLVVRDEAVPIVVAIARRRVLTSMRLVSSGWNTAICQHPYWAEYFSLLWPNFRRQSWDSPPDLSQAFDTRLCCVGCRLFPQDGQYRILGAETVTETSRLGLIGACQSHTNTFCVHCLRWASDGSLRLFMSKEGDTDECGRFRPESEMICKHCRELAFVATLQIELSRCARGGPTFGATAHWMSTSQYPQHVYFGHGAVILMVREAIEDMFLMQSPRFVQRLEQALDFQRMLLLLKTNLFKNGRYTPTAADVSAYDHYRARVWDDEYSEWEDGPSLGQFYTLWIKEINTHQYDEEEFRLDITRLQHNMIFLWPLVRQRVVEACVSQFVADRFFMGYWVMPSDEVDQMLHPDTAVHTPFADIAKSARRPHAGMGNKVQPSSTITNHIGRFRVPAIVDNVDNGVFLPPAPMLQLFDEQFTAVLYRRVQCPMAETVELCRLENGKRLAEELCAALPLNQIIGHMSNEAAWHEGRLARHFLCRPVQRAPPSDAGGSTVVSDEEEDEGEDEDKVMACASPRIEAISDERLAEMGFVVREGWSSATEKDDSSSSAEEEDSEAVDMDEPEVDEYDLDGPDRDSSPFSAGPELPELPSLKRKLSEEEEELPGAVPLRSRLGSGQTSSHSSSGETVNTPLVTPDDSPDLMACAIHLAVDEDADATMDGSGSAPQEGLPAPHPAPASPSSSLGKRKLKDDAIDEALDGSERQRLRRSTSVASSKSVVDEGEEDGENKDVDEIKREDELAVPEKPPFEKSPLADHSGATTESTPMASSEEADTRSGDMTPSDPTASTTASAPSSPPIKPVPVYAVRTEPAPKLSIEEHPSNGHKALDDDLDLEDDFDDEDYEGYTTSDSGDDPGDPIPFVPSPMTEFGPRAKDVMQRAWYAACAPLRQCECRICVRAKANELSFSFMGLGTWEDADAMLRIA